MQELLGSLPWDVAKGVHHAGSWSVSHTGPVESPIDYNSKLSIASGKTSMFNFEVNSEFAI